MHGSQLISFRFPYSEPQKVMFFYKCFDYLRVIPFPLGPVLCILEYVCIVCYSHMLALQDLEGHYIQEAFMDS